MALRPPIALNAASLAERPTAKEFRLMLQALAGADTNDVLKGIAFPSTGLKVTDKNGTDDMSVDIAAGGAFLPSTEDTEDGCYFVYNDATVNLPVPAAHPTNPRKDLVIVHVRDSAFSGANDDAQFALVQGTPASSPVEPDPAAQGYKNFLVLAMIDVPALDTAIGAGQITDRRVASVTWSRGRGEVAYVENSSLNDANTTIADTVGLTTGSYQEVSGRRYLFTFTAEVAVTGDTTLGLIVITDGSNNQYTGKQISSLTGVTRETTVIGRKVATATASVTAKVRHARMNGSGTFNIYADSGRAASLLVQDIGGTLN